MDCSAENLTKAYALDNQNQKVWWAALLRETHAMRDNKGIVKSHPPSRYDCLEWGGWGACVCRPGTPRQFRAFHAAAKKGASTNHMNLQSRRWESPSSPASASSPGGGVAGVAAPYFDYSPPQSNHYESLDSPVAARIELSGQVQDVLRELAIFFRSRRVDVADAFVDFEMPGRFCKRVRRVTRFQFQEVLFFIAKGLSGLTSDHVALLSDAFDDGTGLVRYREFIKAVDLQLEDPGSAGAIPHAANSNPPKTATLRGASSPRRTMLGSSLR